MGCTTTKLIAFGGRDMMSFARPPHPAGCRSLRLRSGNDARPNLNGRWGAPLNRASTPPPVERFADVGGGLVGDGEFAEGMEHVFEVGPFGEFEGVDADPRQKEYLVAEK